MMIERFKFWLRTRRVKHWTCSRCCLFCRSFERCEATFDMLFGWFS